MEILEERLEGAAEAERSLDVPDEVRAAAEALAAAGEVPPLEKAHLAGRLRAAERRTGVRADGSRFEEKPTASVGSLRQAIDAKCRECIVDEKAAGSAAVQVELCACYDCPLWLVRPVRSEPRSFYSAAVLEEQGLSKAEARARFEQPRARQG